MNDSDVRALKRAVILLVAVSAVRWAWQGRAPGLYAVSGPTADTLAPLLEQSRVLADEARARGEPLAPGERIDPNRAAEVELDRLPGIGAGTARAIVASREAEGAFRSAADLGRVRGVGPATVEKIAPFLDLSLPPPPDLAPRARPPAARGQRASAPAASARVDVNRADEAELRTLPGVGPAIAARILDARAEAPFRTVDDLLRVRGIGPATLERLRPRVAVSGKAPGPRRPPP